MSDRGYHGSNTIVRACKVCGREDHDVEGWGLTIEQYDLGDETLDVPTMHEFCSLDCFREWVDSDPAVIARE